MAIVNSWSVSDFAQMKGRMQLAGPFTDSETQETYHSLAFTHPSNTVIDPNTGNERPEICFVSFSRNLGELTAEQVGRMHRDLQIVENEEGRFSICKKGESTWQDIVLS
jgi:hypothetical protein